MSGPQPLPDPAPPAAPEEMRLADLFQVVEIERKSFLDPWPLNSFVMEFVNRQSRRLVLRAGTPPQVVAYIVFWLAADEVHVNNVAVHPEHRRRGHAERLLREALRAGRAAGGARAFLEVRRSNQAAAGLYRKLGFREIGVRRRYYSDNGEDALVMGCDLRAAAGAGGGDAGGAGGEEDG